MNYPLVRTKSFLPAMWEEGGGRTNTGGCNIIAAADGTPLKPVYIRRRGDLACREHALFIVKKGDLFIHANHHRGDFEILVSKIAEIIEDKAVLEPLFAYEMGEWDEEPPQEILAAVEAAKEKALCYHCREPHYIAEAV